MHKYLNKNFSPKKYLTATPNLISLINKINSFNMESYTVLKKRKIIN